jgi:hypothetical protein
MSSRQEIIALDTSGDVLLLLETNDDQSDIIPPADEIPAHEARAEQVSTKHLSLASKVFDDMFQCQPRHDVGSQDRQPAIVPPQKDNFESLQTLLWKIVKCATHEIESDPVASTGGVSSSNCAQ